MHKSSDNTQGLHERGSTVAREEGTTPRPERVGHPVSDPGNNPVANHSHQAYYSVMPDVLHDVVNSPQLQPKSLLRRAQRADGGMRIIRNSEPARIAVALRKAIRLELEIATDAQEMPEVRREALDAAMPAIDRLLDLLHYPKRPAFGANGDKHAVDIRKLLDITPQVTPGPGPGAA